MPTPRKTPRKTPSKARVSMTPSRLPPRKTPRKAATPSIPLNSQGSEGIQVAIRMRPLNSNENTRQRIWKVLPKYSSVAQTTPDGKPLPERVSGRTFFTFDKTFGENSSTQEVYNDSAKNIVSSVVTGLNGTIFAYGQTSSGKTFTMQGSGTIEEGSSGSGGGIVHMAAMDIFNHIADTPDRVFVVQASFLEIYNEDVRDLLADDRKTLQIREDPRRGVFVQSEDVTVTNFESLLGVLFRGEKSRAFASTAMNERSSRSHTIFRITIESRQKSGDQENETEGPAIVSTLNLVDLAGSESVRHTGASGDRQKEGGMINQSLLTLSRVIVALGTPNQTHVNFRDSKLTRILQPSLSGNARMAVICCATPSELYLEETRSTLQFASRAKLVKTNAQVNEVMDDRSMIRKLQQELAEARKAMDGATVGAAPEHVRKLEQKVENAGSSARAAEERLRRLQSSILNGGVLFGEKPGVTGPSAGKNRRKRRNSDGNLRLLSPSKQVVTIESPKTLPRRTKKSKAVHAKPVSTSSQLDLVREALRAKKTYTVEIASKIDELSELLRSQDAMDESLSISTKSKPNDLPASLVSLQKSLATILVKNEEEMKEKSSLLENALGQLDVQLSDRINFQAAIGALEQEKTKMLNQHNMEVESVRIESKERESKLTAEQTIVHEEALASLQAQHDEEVRAQQELAKLVTDENESLKERLLKKSECLDEVTSSQTKLVSENESQKQKIDRLEAALAESKDLSTRLTKKLRDSEAKVSLVSANLGTTQVDLEASKKETSELTAALVESRSNEAAALERENCVKEMLKASNAELENMQEVQKVLDEKYEKIQIEKGLLEEQVSNQSSELSVAADELQSIQTRLVEEATSAQESIAALEKSLSAKEINCSELESQVETLETTRSGLENDAEQQRERVSLLEAQISKNESLIAEYTSEMDVVTKEIGEFRIQVNELESALSDKEAENTSLSGSVEHLKEQVQAQQVSALNADTESKSIRLDLTNSQKRSEELENTLNETASKLSNAERQNTALAQQLDEEKKEIQILLAHSDDLERNFSSISDDLQNSKSIEQTLRSNLEAVELQKDCLEDESKKIKAKLSQLQEDCCRVSTLESENEQLSKERELVEKQLVSAGATIHDVQTENTNLRRQLEHRSNQALGFAITAQTFEADLRIHSGALRDEIDRTKTTLDAVSAENEQLSANLESQNTQISFLKQKMNEGDRELSGASSECTRLSGALEAEVSEKERVLAQLQSVTDVQTALEHRIAAISQSEEDLKCEAQTLERMLEAANSKCEAAERQGFVEKKELQEKLSVISVQKDEQSQRLVNMAEQVTTMESKLLASIEESRSLKMQMDELKPKPARRLILLVSGQPINRDIASKQERARLILQSTNLPVEEMDGADESNNLERTKLFNLSGIGARYPQLFVEDNVHTEYWGDWDRLEALNDSGDLTSDLRSRTMCRSIPELQNDIHEAEQRVRDLEVTLVKTSAESKQRADELIELHEQLEATELRHNAVKQQLNIIQDDLESKENMLTQSAVARQEESASAQADAERYMNTIRDLQAEMEVVKTSSASQHELMELKQLLASSNGLIEDSLSESTGLRRLLEEKENQLRKAKTVIDELESSTKVDNESEDTRQLREEVERLRALLENEKLSRAAFEEEQKNLRGEEQRALIHEAEMSMERVRHENSELQQSLSRCETEAYTARECTEELRDQMKEKVQELIQVESKLAAYENENARLKRAVRRHDSESETEKKSMSAELRKIKAELEQTGRDLRQSDAERQSIKQELDSVLGTMAKLDVPGLESKNRALNLEIARLKDLHEEEDNSVNTLEIAKENRDLQESLVAMRSELKAKEERIKKLSATKLTKAQVAAMKKMKAENTESKKRLESMEKEMEQLRDNQNNVISGDHTELAELRFGRDALESKLRKYAAHCQRLEEEKAEITNVLRTMNCLEGENVPEAVVRVCDKLSSLEEECTSLSMSENQASSFMVEVETLRTHNSALQTHVSEAKKKADRLMRNEIKLSERVASLTREKQELERMVSDEESAGHRESKVRFLEQENLQLGQELKNIKRQLRQTKSELALAKVSSVEEQGRELRDKERNTKKRERPSTPADKENAANPRPVPKSSVKKGRTMSTRKERRVPGLGQAFPDTPENTQECKQS